MGWDVALAAGIGVPPPGSTHVRSPLKDDEVMHARLLEAIAQSQPGEASADDHNVHVPRGTRSSRPVARRSTFAGPTPISSSNSLSSRLNHIQCTESYSFVNQFDFPATFLNMVQSKTQGAPKALDQARRRVVKPPDQRRREILAAAEDLFRHRGYDATTVQAIARAAGVAAGTVYLYFPSKEAVLVALQEDFETGLLDRVAEIAEQVLSEEDASGEIVGYQEVVERLIDGMVEYAVQRRAACQVIARQAAGASVVPDALLLQGGLNDVLTSVIHEGVRLGYIATSDPQIAAYLLNLAAVSALAHAIAFEDEAMLERVVRQTKELYIKGLAPVNAS